MIRLLPPTPTKFVCGTNTGYGGLSTNLSCYWILEPENPKPKTQNPKPQNRKTTPYDWWLVIRDDFTASDAKPINFLILFADDMLHLSESSPFVWFLIGALVVIHRTVLCFAAPHQTYRNIADFVWRKCFPWAREWIILFIGTSRFIFWLKLFYLLTTRVKSAWQHRRSSATSAEHRNH